MAPSAVLRPHIANPSLMLIYKGFDLSFLLAPGNFPLMMSTLLSQVLLKFCLFVGSTFPLGFGHCPHSCHGRVDCTDKFWAEIFSWQLCKATWIATGFLSCPLTATYDIFTPFLKPFANKAQQISSAINYNFGLQLETSSDAQYVLGLIH